MTTTAQSYLEERIAIAGTELYLLRGGEGRPLLVLHGVEGHEGWLPFHEALSASSNVYVPAHPGYGETARPDWLEAIAHQAVFYHWFIERAGLAGTDVAGFGIGGWIAAQMAVMCPQNIGRLVLVNAAGIRPREGEILDIFIIPWKQVIEQGFYDAEACPEYHRLYGGDWQEFGGPREAGRTMSIQMCFRPFMYDRALPGMLGKVTSPTLVVWGADNKIIPAECGRLYQQAIPGASLHEIDRCGHWPQLERPVELADVIRNFLAA